MIPLLNAEPRTVRRYTVDANGVRVLAETLSISMRIEDKTDRNPSAGGRYGMRYLDAWSHLPIRSSSPAVEPARYGTPADAIEYDGQVWIVDSVKAVPGPLGTIYRGRAYDVLQNHVGRP